MTRTVADNAALLNALAGYDRRDLTSVARPAEDYVAALAQPVSGLRLGKPLGFEEGVDPEILAACEAAYAVLARLTRGLRDVSLPNTSDLSIATLGYAGETWAWHEQTFRASPAKYQLASRRRLEGAAKNEPKAPDYIRAKWKLDLLRRTIDDAFADYDLVVCPTQRIVAPTLDELITRAHSTTPMNPLVTSNCSPFNIFGLPSISLPCGYSKSGLPIGLMISGPTFADGKVLALAQAYEQATQWHLRKPPLNPKTPVPPVVKGA